MQQVISLAMLVQWTDIAALAVGALLYYYGRIHGKRAGRAKAYQQENEWRMREELDELKEELRKMKGDD